MTVLVVLGILSITLALSYSLLRSQATTARIQQNSNQGTQARQAAQTGLAVGLRRMHQSDWLGVNTTLTGALGSSQSYQVAYQSGDLSLTPASPDYAELPYRVTLLCTGTVTDPSQPSLTATHRIRAVVRLAPRQLPFEPADWQAAEQYTVYQRTGATTISWVDVPGRVEGPVRLQTALRLCEKYAMPNEALSRYLGDLNAMRANGYADFRPFDGPLSLPFMRTKQSTLDLLTDQLSVPLVDVPEGSRTGWNHPGVLATYRIYPGGQQYQVPALGPELRDITLGPDPLTNPLGIYCRRGDVTLGNNVAIRGTLVASGKVVVQGTNVRIEPAGLPPLAETSEPVRLPVAVVGTDFLVGGSAQGSVQGVVAAWGKFEILRGSAGAMFALAGRVITGGLVIGERAEWDHSAKVWQDLWQRFSTQGSQPAGGAQPGGGKSQPATNPTQPAQSVVRYFPVWLEGSGMAPAPLLTIRPDPTPATDHWKNAADPVYVPGPSDVGLRWDLVQWTDNP